MNIIDLVIIIYLIHTITEKNMKLKYKVGTLKNGLHLWPDIVQIRPFSIRQFVQIFSFGRRVFELFLQLLSLHQLPLQPRFGELVFGAVTIF